MKHFTMVIYWHSVVINVVILFYNTEGHQCNGMAVNYHFNFFITLANDSWRYDCFIKPVWDRFRIDHLTAFNHYNMPSETPSTKKPLVSCLLMRPLNINFEGLYASIKCNPLKPHLHWQNLMEKKSAFCSPGLTHEHKTWKSLPGTNILAYYQFS